MPIKTWDRRHEEPQLSSSAVANTEHSHNQHSLYITMLPSLLILWSCISAASARATPSDICDCSGTRNGGPGSESYICGDPRLGPIVLPQMLPLASFITTYDRFGGLTPGEFLAKWTDSSGNYAYPEQNGFQLDEDGDAINGTMVLQPDTLVDRFGSEFGT